MAERACPACKTALEGNVSADGVCLTCGHDLAATAPPPNWYRGNLDLRRTAKHQRRLLWVIFALLVLYLVPVLLPIPYISPPIVDVVSLVVIIALDLVALVFTIQLMSALQYHILLRVLLGLLMFAPCVNLIVLLAINSSATNALRAAGLKVGLLGVSDEQVVRLLGANRCRECGYLLVGNTTGICPECGSAVVSTFS